MSSKARSMKLRDLVKGFFQSYLPGDRGASPRTIETYRYAVALWMQDLGRQGRTRRPAHLRVAHLSPDHVLCFLRRLEKERHNSISTRNARLAALKSLFRYATLVDPSSQGVAEQVARIPTKLGSSSSREPLTRDEVRALIHATPPSSPTASRDRAMLQLLYNAGARASEIAGLRTSQLTLEGPDPHVRLLGKGGRWRTTPLLGSTPLRIREYLKHRREPVGPDSYDLVFLNRTGRPLTRLGIRQIVLRCARIAARTLPSLVNKRVTTHMLRHATATHMLRSGVDLSTVQAWLGHVHVDTTSGYVRYSALDARAALEKFRQTVDFVGGAHAEEPPRDGSMDRWLASL